MADRSLFACALDGLVAELRAVGLPLSVSEKVDALHVLAHLPLDDRRAVKSGLRAALVKKAEHESVFDVVFDLYVATTVSGGTVFDALGDEELRALVRSALLADRPGVLETAARVVVDRYAGIEPGRPVAGTYYLFLALQASGALEIARRRTGAESLQGRLLREAVDVRVESFRTAVESEIRRRLVADRGPDAVARTLRVPLPEDVDLLRQSGERIGELREVVAVFARSLAATLAAGRACRRAGRLDVRKTMRRSLSHGGVPLVPSFRPARRPKPNVVVLADISGSVAAFAVFALQLVFALRSEIAGLRAFVFVDGIAEVTDLLADASDIRGAIRHINDEARGVRYTGSSDYGSALQQFWDAHGEQLGRRTVVIVLGDARGNYRPPGVDAVRAIGRRSARLYWLNPEPKAMWGSGDSAIDAYAPLCDAVFECRNLRQLRAFVGATVRI